MKSLLQRSAAEGREKHAAIAPRIYADDEVQKYRIDRSRGFVISSLDADTGLRIVELGCGTLDICGPFSTLHDVIGVECNPEACAIAARRWPHARLNVFPLDSEACDVIVLCEFLEHIENPSELVANWLPKARYSVISHPLDGDMKGDLSDGEHQWSFSMEDFEKWFQIGGHKLIQSEVFKMGGYQIVIGRGERQC